MHRCVDWPKTPVGATYRAGTYPRDRYAALHRCPRRTARRIFATGGVILTLGGWMMGIPFVLCVARRLIALTQRMFNEHVPFAFRVLNIAIAPRLWPLPSLSCRRCSIGPSGSGPERRCATCEPCPQRVADNAGSSATPSSGYQ
jgi:hypothetical protein